VGKRRLGEQGHGGAWVEIEPLDVAFLLQQADGFRSDSHRPGSLLVAGVADVKDRVALSGAHLELVVHLGHEGTAGVDHHAAPGCCGLLDLGCGPVSREHERRKCRHLVDVVDEDDALAPEFLDDEAVVDDLVVAVNGRLEDAHHPREGLDGHLHARAKAARLREKDARDAACLGLESLTSIGRHSGPGYPLEMPRPQVVAVAEDSPAGRSGLLPGDELRSMNGQVPRDVIEYQLLADEPVVDFELVRGGIELEITVEKEPGEPLGLEISAAIFDRVRTCDNHCEFCFIYQLPKGMRRSLYLKDDDYRLSFLYGNFTTLTRFTEVDLERVVDQRLSPLYVSIHATDPDVRSRMLRNPRGAVSLRWLRHLLDHGIEVHGQVVVCPGLNDGPVLHQTLAGILDRFPELVTAAIVPLGVSRYSKEAAMRAHTTEEARATVETVEEWQLRFSRAVGRRVVWASDEYYLLAGLPFPDPSAYEGFPQHENGVGMVRAFEEAFQADTGPVGGLTAAPARTGFFAWVEGAPAEGYRAPRTSAVSVLSRPAKRAAPEPISILTGAYGELVLRPVLDRAGFGDVNVVAVRNDFFGGNISVAGLITGSDLARTLAGLPDAGRYLLPDVCLSKGRFLDGSSVADLPREIEVVPADGASLRRVLEARR
jgi:putative radical SAM enzyme (TIGR03279 family)